ncbi:hypothetical protein EJ04DRAFT_75403 [Polyplosphaeria fusca]|uniref:Uncharacterized protein n=1 Tax=Polyplosphaeria fusca TaxID=682080 RepID=A0A9P4QPF1_9PLEO|nr:hypothetical protein EJ04DRAFT_75403 [Polyplosphaeria fusca]
MIGQLPISLLSVLVWSCSVNASPRPADPTITAPALLPRQQAANFIGWVEASGTWYSETCNPGLTWYQDGEYGQCCPTTVASCYAPTACVDGSLIYPFSDLSSTTTIACTDNFGDAALSICNTAFIYENFDDSSPQTDIVCGSQSDVWSYYRKIPASATELVSTSSESPKPSPTSTPSKPSSGTVDSAVATSTRTSIPSSTPQKSSSKAWIAGVVVGPIVGLALIGALVFFLLRRKRNNNNAANHGAPTLIQPPAQFNETKPAFPPQVASAQPSPGYQPQDPYSQQPISPPMSPAPQYAAPYQSPGSPPPVGGHYAPDVKYAYEPPSHPEAAELGGPSSAAPVTTQHTAELGGASVAAPVATHHTAELDGGNAR